MLSGERSHGERYDAAVSLFPHRDRAWWREKIAELTDEGGEDAPSLAHELIERIDADVSDPLLVATLFAEMGATSCSLPRSDRERGLTVRLYKRLVEAIPPVRVPGVLNLIIDYSELLVHGDWETVGDVADIVARLLIRALDKAVVGPSQAPAVWRWLKVIEQAHHHGHRDIIQQLAQRLATHDALRRAIQTHALANDRRDGRLWTTVHHLELRLVSLNRPDDLAYAFNRLVQGDPKDPVLRQDWQDLVCIGWGPNGLSPDVHAASEAFRRGDKLLGDFLHKLTNPKKQPWQVRQEKEAAKRALKRKVAFEAARRKFTHDRDDLRAGKLEAILPCAKAYLGWLSDLPRELPPGERLAEWLGPKLRDDALVGWQIGPASDRFANRRRNCRRLSPQHNL